MKISKRARVLLTIIADWTERDASGNLQRYWTPSGGRIGHWSDTLGEHFDVSGPGDARILRSLMDKGLTEHVPRNLGNAYACAITKAGLDLLDDASTLPRRQMETDTAKVGTSKDADRGLQIRELYEYAVARYNDSNMIRSGVGAAYADIQHKMLDLWPWLKKGESDV